MKMIREDWDKFASKFQEGYIICNCQTTIETIPQLRNHWQQGHFDTLPEETKINMKRDFSSLFLELQGKDYVICNCKMVLETVPQIKGHIELGHFEEKDSKE